jgi:hypothetical protein
LYFEISLYDKQVMTPCNLQNSSFRDAKAEVLDVRGRSYDYGQFETHNLSTGERRWANEKSSAAERRTTDLDIPSWRDKVLQDVLDLMVVSEGGITHSAKKSFARCQKYPYDII